MRWRSSWVVLPSLGLFALAVACSSERGGSAEHSESERAGALGLRLSLAPGASLDAVAYTITGPGGFSQAGNIDVSRSSSLQATLALPAGLGYSIALSGAATEGSASCSGAATFDIAAHQTTPVTVKLLCREAPRLGSALVSGELNQCAAIDALSATPAEVLVGASLSLSVVAHDADAGPAALSYVWATSGGTLSRASSASPQLTCTAPGTVTVSVAVSDGDPAVGCTDSASVTVECSPVPDGGGSGGVGGMSAAGAGGSTAGGGSAGSGGVAGGANGGGGGVAGGGGVTGGSGGAAGGGSGGAAGAAGAGGALGGSGEATAGNVVVYRVGDGAGGLVNTGNPVFIDEFDGAGSLVTTTALPLAASGAQHRLVASGTATSEGLITRSVDGRYVLLTGYDAALPTTGLAGTTGTANPRVVGRIDAAHNIDTTTIVTDGASGNNPRSVASTDGNSLWFTGAAGGVRFLTLGNTGATTQLSTTVTNLRQVAIFDGQLFVSDSSGTAVRLGAVGAGLPTTAGQTVVNLPGLATSGSPYGFFFADLSASVAGVDTLYVADDGVGLSKYSLAAGSWTASGTIGSASDAYRGLTGSVSGGRVLLYATRKGGSGATGGGELVSLSDDGGYGGTLTAAPTLLVTVGANMAFRGVALAPTSN